MYMSVSEAAEKFNISKRRVQLLCEQGRIEGADRISGVWLIPANARKPADAGRKSAAPEKQLSLFDGECKTEDDKLNIHQVCEILSVSPATVRNWIRLGKLKTCSNNEAFDRRYIEALSAEIKSGSDRRLKSRRNKKSVGGKVLYKAYIKSSHNLKLVENILNSCKQLTENELRLILAGFAIQLFRASTGLPVSEKALFERANRLTDNTVFNRLIDDLVGHTDAAEIDLANIQAALDSEIQFVPSEDTLGFVYISLRELSRRKQAGAYYTPESTVNALIRNLKESISITGRTFCDPCCGTGNFLIGLVGSGVKIENLYGQDIDELSVLLTRINMFLLDNSSSEELLYSHFICGNTLCDTFPFKFSVVLGNPPWGCSFSKEEAASLCADYITAKSKALESYDLFVEKGLAMLAADGYLAFVLPEAILSVSSHQCVRELILKNTAFRFVHYLGNAFSGVQCPSIILGLRNGYHGSTKGCKVNYGGEEFIIDEDRYVDASSFPFNMNDEEYNCLQAISSVQNVRYLADNARFALGIVTGDNREHISDVRKDGMELILKGSDILRYAIKEAGSYVLFTPEKYQQHAPSELYRAEEKLLYRFIAEVPVFAYDNHQTLSLNSCNILIPQIEGMDIKYVLAILNSSVAAFFINKKFNSVKLLRSHIEALPIPLAESEKQSSIINKAERIMSSRENTRALYTELDNEIMDIYSLSEDQRSIIRRALSGKHLFLSEQDERA